MKTFSVSSSNGCLTASAKTGRVISCELNKDGEGIDQIQRFDVEEWRKAYPGENIAGHSIDILDLGYWDKSGKYEEPEKDWRKEFRKERGTTKTKVLFLLYAEDDEEAPGQVWAFFPEDKNPSGLYTCYDHNGQHGQASSSFATDCVQATPEQAAQLRAELEAIGYIIEDFHPKKCDQCNTLVINGIFTHETGCPNARKSWIDGQWVHLVQCPECGDQFPEGQPCNCQE